MCSPKGQERDSDYTTKEKKLSLKYQYDVRPEFHKQQSNHQYEFAVALHLVTTLNLKKTARTNGLPLSTLSGALQPIIYSKRPLRILVFLWIRYEFATTHLQHNPLVQLLWGHYHNSEIGLPLR